MKLIRVFTFIALAAALAAPPVLAQQSPPAKKQSQKKQQKKKLDRTQQLDGLFAALKVAPNANIAKAIGVRIDALLLVTESDTLNLLMVRARSTIEAKEFPVALELLDAVIGIDPRYTEAWAQRATVHFVQKDFYRALADIRVVLAQEPRHYQALAGLGVILQDLGEDKRALEAFRRALEINPHIENVPDLVKRLKLKVEGREI